MWRSIHALTACGLAGLLLMTGCRNQNVTIPNPLATADRVQPPGLRSVPGAVEPYYTPSAPPFGAGPTTFAPAPAFNTAPAPTAGSGARPGVAPAAPFSQPAPFAQPTTIPPGQAAPVYTPPAGGATAPPFGGGSASRPLDRSRQVAGGDAVTVQPDAGALRFSDPGPTRAPIPRAGGTALASSTRPATASGWIAGSAPVRSAPEAGPRVRLPGATREPVSVAAIDRGVPVAPLEPAGVGTRAGEPAPLRVASPASSTGWR